MILHNQIEKNDFLAECSEHLYRLIQPSCIPTSVASERLRKAKVQVLQTIYDIVNAKQLDDSGINLDDVYKSVKSQLNTSFNTDTVMKSHRELLFENPLDYIVNIFRKKPLSTNFLKSTGFFAVHANKEAGNSHVNILSVSKNVMG